MGIGVSNLSLINYLLGQGARVFAMDRKTREELGETAAMLEAKGVTLRLGPGYLDELHRYELVFLTPGMKKDIPEVERARASGARIESEMGLFLSLCRGRTVAVTGSAGKTTTTTLTGEMLKASGRNVFVGGNIGTPLIERLDDIGEEDLVVLELSSFQLELTKVSPQVAGITNIGVDHLDVHGSAEAYRNAKMNIFRFQRPEDVTALNADDEITRALAPECPGRVLYFSRQSRPDQGAFLKDDRLHVHLDGRDHVLCKASEVGIPGPHNLENALLASLLSISAGADPDAVSSVLVSFKGIEHRLETVCECNGVRYVNDSIATSPVRAIAALRTVPAPILLIAGGYDKGLPYREYARAMRGKVRILFTLGKTAEKIERAVREELGDDAMPIQRVESLEQAVMRSHEEARPGDTVLLSPASASYDMFRNFEERGRRFKQLVREMVGR